MHHRIMIGSERESTIKLQGLGVSLLPAINASAAEKQNPAHPLEVVQDDYKIGVDR